MSEHTPNEERHPKKWDRAKKLVREMFSAEPAIVTKLSATLIYTIAIGFGLGLFAALLLFPELEKFSATNALSVGFRNAGLLNMAGWIGGSIAVVGAALLYKRNRGNLDRVHDWVRALSPLGWLWPAPLFFNWKVFDGNGLIRVIIALLWGLGLELSFRHTFRVFGPFLERQVARFAHAWRVRATWLILGTLIAYFGWFCARYTIMQHERMATTGFDLGIFDNLLFNLGEGEWFRGGVDRDNRGGAHLQFHANFLAYLFVPAYMLSPRAETLLIMQAWIVGFSAIPFYLLASQRLKSAGAGLVIAFVYLVHEAVQGPVFYDFHFLTVSPFFIGWTLYFFDRGWKWPLFVAWTFAVLLREDQGAVLGAAALVYLLMGHRPVLSIIGGILGVAWLGLMRFYVMPLHVPNGSFHQHIGIFQAMVAPGDVGFGGVIKTMVTNPIFTLNNVMEARKLEYVLLLACPFVLLPFRSPRLLWLFVPPAMFTLGTANYPPPVSKGFQYTMYWMPMLVLGTVLKLDQWRNDEALKFRVPAALFTILVIGTALGFNGGALFQQNSFTGGFRRIVFEISDEEKARIAELRAVVSEIPRNATLTATEGVVPHVSNRRDAHTLRQGVGDPDYLILWKQEVRGGPQAQHLLAGLGPIETQRYGVIKTTKNFMVWKRGAPRAGNLKALRSLGLMVNRQAPGTAARRPAKKKHTEKAPTEDRSAAPGKAVE